ncbi:MAG: acyl-CoA thioesterase [Acidobacteria bacterium]|nr:acyl-CoA thioesterase [Acidobacteriota bacterium]
MQEIRCSIPVRFRDLDALGHVNYATYLNYLEEAFTRLWVAVLAKTGKTLDVKEYGCVTARTEIDYRSSAQYGDMLDVTV